MFYDDVKTYGNSSIEDDFIYLRNYLDKLPEAIYEVSSELLQVCSEQFDEANYMHSAIYKFPEIMKDHFKNVIDYNRELGYEIIKNHKELVQKLNNNGLIGDSLYVKLSLIDWLWKSVGTGIDSVRGGVINGLALALINSLQSFLNSLLKVLGFDPDILNEDLNILLTLIEMAGNKFYKN